MTPEEYCAARAAPPGSSPYYALLFHPAQERRALRACFALIEEIRRRTPASTDPAPVGRRLLWWLEELGDERFATSRHPVMVELRRLPIAPAEIRRTVEPAIHAVKNELSGWQPDSELDWQSHCRALHATAWQLGAQFCNPHLDDDTLSRIDVIATAAGQLEHIRELPARIMAGRCPLPRTLMDEQGLNQLQGKALLADPRLLAAIATSLRGIYPRLSQPAAPPGSSGRPPLFAQVLRQINLALCEQLLRQPERIQSGRVGLTPLLKLWIAWRSRGKTQTNS